MRLRLLLSLAGLLSVGVQATEIELTFVGASRAELDNPHDLKLSPDGRYLFVADVDNDRVAILDPDSLMLLAEFGADHQGGPHDVDFDARGRAYVADTHNNRVAIYDIDGTRARLTGELGERVRGPEGVLVHPNGRIYVAGAWSGNVVAYDDGEIVAERGGLASPHDIELATDGNLWLAEAGASRVLLLSPELEILRELDRAAYGFNGVRYLDVTADGILIAADKYTHSIKFIGDGGKLLHALGDGDAGLGVNRFKTPEGVEVRGGELWLSDSGNDRVVKYALEIR